MPKVTICTDVGCTDVRLTESAKERITGVCRNLLMCVLEGPERLAKLYPASVSSADEIMREPGPGGCACPICGCTMQVFAPWIEEGLVKLKEERNHMLAGNDADFTKFDEIAKPLCVGIMVTNVVAAERRQIERILDAERTRPCTQPSTKKS